MLPCWRGAPAHGEGEEPPCWSILCCGDRRGAHGGASGCAAAARLPLPVRTQQGAWDCRCLRRTGARVPGCRKEARGHGHASLGSAAMAAPAAAARPRSRRHGEQNGQGRCWRGRGWCGAAHRVLDLGGGKPEGGDRRWGRSFGEAPMVGGTGEPIPAEEEVGRPRGGAVENEGDSVELTWGLNRAEEVCREELGVRGGGPAEGQGDRWWRGPIWPGNCSNGLGEDWRSCGARLGGLGRAESGRDGEGWPERRRRRLCSARLRPSSRRTKEMGKEQLGLALG